MGKVVPVFFPKAMVKQSNCLGADVCMEEKYFSGAYCVGSHCCGCSWWSAGFSSGP